MKKNVVVLVILILFAMLSVGCSSKKKLNNDYVDNPFKNHSMQVVTTEEYENYFIYEYVKGSPKYYDEYMKTIKELNVSDLSNSKDVPVSKIKGKNGIIQYRVVENPFSLFRYIGNVKNGKPNGVGLILYTPDPTVKSSRRYKVYMGNFKNGVYEGYGREYHYPEDIDNIYSEYHNFDNDSVSRFKRNKVIDYANFMTYEGIYEEGLLNGEGISIIYDNLRIRNINEDKPYITGKIIVGYVNYSDGKENGDITVYTQDNNGIGYKLYQFPCKNGIMQGSGSIWDANGNVVFKGEASDMKGKINIYDQYMYNDVDKIDAAKKLEAAKEVLERKNIKGELLGTSYDVNKGMFLNLIKVNNHCKFIIANVTDDIIAEVPYHKSYIDFIDSPKEQFIVFLNVLNDKKEGSDSEFGEWYGTNHKLPVLTKFSFSNGGNVIPTSMESNQGSRLSIFMRPINEEKNKILIKIFVTDMSILKENCVVNGVEFNRLANEL